MDTDPRRESSFPACGRLIVLQSRGDRTLDLFDNGSVDNKVDFVSINFPAMPDVIELSRQADYTVSTNQAFPDGIHMYKGTSVLEIPVSFRLHAFDKEYCPQGVLTLLQVAANLHALSLPFGPDDNLIAVGPASQTAQGVPEGTDKAQLKGSDQDLTAKGFIETKDIFPPPTCYLELIVTDRDSPGIACIGYVKNVSVKLGGPYMRGPGISRNLPRVGEFSFTFVHHPGHGNANNVSAVQGPTERQAFAGKVKKRLYNTNDLVTNPSNWRGF